MDADKAAQLRAPFPPSAIGKLPKPYRADSPKGNLWIRLTVAGVTRIGVGDGKSMKEIIGDAIRNSAMRFGVALDLWAKEDLHEGRSPVPVASEMPPAERARPTAPVEQSPADAARSELLAWAREHATSPRDLNDAHVAAHGRGLGDEEDVTLIRAHMTEAAA